MKQPRMGVSIILLVALALLGGCHKEDEAVRARFLAGDVKLLVCPVHLLVNQESASDTILAQRIADVINQRTHTTANRTSLCPPPYNKWSANEAKMLSNSIDQFIGYVRQLNIPADTYVLYVEFLRGGHAKMVVGVHYCLLDHAGGIAMIGLLNNHWEEFKKVNPRTDEECVAVFMNGYEGKLKGQ